MQKAVSFNRVAIAFDKRNYYIIHFWHMSKDKAINLLKNADLTENAGTPYNIKIYCRIENK